MRKQDWGNSESVQKVALTEKKIHRMCVCDDDDGQQQHKKSIYLHFPGNDSLRNKSFYMHWA